MHPVVPAVYALFAFVLTMTAFQPIFIAIALLGAVCLLCALGSAGQLARMMLWTLPLALFIIAINPLFAANGTTVALQVGERAIYLEGIVYGLCMAGMLFAVIVEFVCAGQIMTSDRVMALTGRAAPVVSLMLSQVNRMVSRFMRQGRQIAGVQAACTAAGVAGMRKVSIYGRVISVLVGWSLEDSLETADAMRARGWRRTMRRSSYRRHRFSRSDVLALCVVVILGVTSAWVDVVGMEGFSFYPVMTPLVLWWGYVPYTLFFFLPSIILLGERL